jgi:plastocyanin
VDGGRREPRESALLIARSDQHEQRPEPESRLGDSHWLGIGNSKYSFEDTPIVQDGVQIKARDAITWTNGGSQAHTVTSTSGGGFDTGLVDPGQAYSLTFDQPGIYVYTCAPHPWMLGRVVVTDAAGNAPPDTAPADPNTVHP